MNVRTHAHTNLSDKNIIVICVVQMLQGVTLWSRKCIALSNLNGPFDSFRAPGDSELTSKRQ